MSYAEKVHKILPALCIASGTILVVGAAYIGIGHTFTLGYATVGLTCLMAGTFMAAVRRKPRAQEAGLRL